MKKILISLLILGVAAITTGILTRSFFFDEEISTGNILKAGKVDLRIDKFSYYWLGGEFETDYWGLRDLTDELFYNHRDLKPGDWEESTISFHLYGNPGWLCADITLTSNEDNSCNEPELKAEPECGTDGPEMWNGELADEVYFLLWTDDGDNVFEADEEILFEGPASGFENTVTIALADSNENIWTGTGAMQPEQTTHIGKAWCYGEMEISSLPQGDVHGLETGFSCDGEGVGNATQTDRFYGDIKFRVVQERHNDEFVCE